MRLVAEMSVQPRFLPQVRRIVRQEECRMVATRVSPKWFTVLIYRDRRVLDLMRQMKRKRRIRDLDIWCMGKVFGYGDLAVIDFIQRTHRKRRATGRTR